MGMIPAGLLSALGGWGGLLWSRWPARRAAVGTDAAAPAGGAPAPDGRRA